MVPGGRPARTHVAEAEIGFDEVPSPYRGYFDNSDGTLHKLVVAGSWLFLVVAAILHHSVVLTSGWGHAKWDHIWQNLPH